MEIIRCNWTRNVNEDCLHCFSTASDAMRRTVFPPNAQDQRVLPLPCSISLQKFLEFLFTDTISAKVSTGFFPRQKRGSSRPCKSTPRYPHHPRMSHKVMYDLHHRDCSRAGDIQPMYPQTHPSCGLWDVWHRPKGSQVVYDNQEAHHHSWWTTRNQDMATEGGKRNIKALFAPLRKVHT